MGSSTPSAISASPSPTYSEQMAENQIPNELHQGTASPIAMLPNTVTNDIGNPMSPLSIYDHAAAKAGVLHGPAFSSAAVQDTGEDEMDAVSDAASENLTIVLGDDLPTEDDHPVANDTVTSPKGAGNGYNTRGATSRNRLYTNESLLSQRSHKNSAATTPSDAGITMSPDPGTTGGSVKVNPRKKRNRTPVDLENLPNPEDELTDPQIESLFVQPPKIRREYTRYFSGTGHVRAGYLRLLFQRLPSGELRYPEEFIKTRAAKWKDRLEAYEASEAAHSTVGHAKRKAPATPAKRSTEDESDAPKKTKKPRTRKGDEDSVAPPIPEVSPPQSTLPRVRLLARRVRLSTDPPPEPTAGPSTDGQEEASESLPEACTNIFHRSTVHQNLDAQGHASQQQNSGPSFDWNIGNTGSLINNPPGQLPRPLKSDSSPFLDPDYLAHYTQFLTGEIHKLDLVVVEALHSPNDCDRVECLRNFWNSLVRLRNSCVSMKMEQRNYLAKKERDGIDQA